MKATIKSAILLSSALALIAGTSSLTGPAAQAQGGDTLAQIQPNAEMVSQGAELFKANGCNGCHGDQGNGDGPAAAALNPKPRNFHTKDAWKNGQSFAGLYKTLEEGLPGTPMSPFGHLPAKDRVAIINYIRSLAPANYPAPSAADVESLEKTYGLSEALNKAATTAIPVDKAIELLIAEDKPQQDKVQAALKKLQASADAGAALIMTSSYNQERMLTTLVHAGNSWKGSSADFAKMVLADPDSNGFKAATAGYTSAQWQALQNALKKLL